MSRADLRLFETQVDQALRALDLPPAAPLSAECLQHAREVVSRAAQQWQSHPRRHLLWTRCAGIAAAILFAFIGTKTMQAPGVPQLAPFGDEPLLAWAAAFEESSDQLAAQVSGYDEVFSGDEAGENFFMEDFVDDAGA